MLCSETPVLSLDFEIGGACARRGWDVWYYGRDEAIFIGPLSVELKPPFEADMSPAQKPLQIRIRFALLWLLLSLFLVIPLRSTPFPAYLLVLVVPAIALAVIGSSVYWLKHRRRAHFSDKDVSVRETKWGLESAWSAPYTAFEGVLLRERTLRGRTQTRTFHIIELRHPDPGKSLPIHIAVDEPLPIDVWKRAAETLRLPSLIEVNGGVVPYPAEHMTTPIRELAQNGLISVDFHGDEMVPEDLSLRRGGKDETEALAVIVKASNFPLWLKASLAGIVVLVFLTGLLTLSLFGLLLSVVLAGLLGLTFWLESRRSRTILITRHSLTLRYPWAGLGPASNFSLELGAITSIRGRESPAGLGRELIIEADEGRIATGPGLDSKTLSWLRRFLIATIASA